MELSARGIDGWMDGYVGGEEGREASKEADEEGLRKAVMRMSQQGAFVSD